MAVEMVMVASTLVVVAMAIDVVGWLSGLSLADSGDVSVVHASSTICAALRPSLGGCRHYISFTDNKTRLTYIHFLLQKSEAFSAYKYFETWFQTQHGETLHSDCGGEYLGKEIIMHPKSARTAQKLIVHDTPQHNGISEQLNRTLLECVP